MYVIYLCKSLKTLNVSHCSAFGQKKILSYSTQLNTRLILFCYSNYAYENRKEMLKKKIS